ncbi:extracellular tyrosine-protein kinase PKDCC-like [Elysia marginata]|uniref:Extracellular tyrosine-protein kinase PKDCC-like n=1 Tax=Elysia marginata TaxID=1093978 RepID=A0AAV4HID0_9GAST|nr:extracellular tyrosine-protein kinase PKDCC-like [Elysia marginata]
MSLRRILFNCRMRRPIVALGVSVLLFSIALLYHALMSEDSIKAGIFSLPRENRKGLRFQSKINLGVDGNGDPLAQDSNDLLIQAALESVHERDLLSTETKEAAANFLAQLYPKKWSTATETDEMALELKHFLADYGLGGTIGCQEIDRMKVGSPITFSRTKTIDLISKDDSSSRDSSYDQSFHGGMRVINTGPSMALKTFNGDSDTKILCMREIYDPEYCEVMGNYRLLREILLLSTLQHSGVVSLKGCCLRGNRLAPRLQDKGILLVTESGTPLTQSMTYSSSWPQQLWMALQVTRLLIYLDESPVGSLRFNKLDLKDFVLVQNKDVKLADLDDLELGEKSCSSSSDCEHNGRNFPCSKGRCDGLNSRKNLDLAIINVLSLILSHPPRGIDEAAKDFINRLSKLEFDSTAAVAGELKGLLKQASPVRPLVVRESGNNGMDSSVRHNNYQVESMHQDDFDRSAGRDTSNQEAGGGGGVVFSGGALSQFDRYNRTNYPGIFDYPCSGSRVSWGCFHTVASLQEVAIKCISDPRCKSFITFSTKPESESLMTVVMKNSSDLAISRSSSGTTLFIRRSGYVSKDEEPLGPWGKVDKGSDKVKTYRSADDNNNHKGAGLEPERHENSRKEGSVDNNSLRRDLGADDDEDEDDIADNENEDSRLFTEISKCLDGVSQSMTSAYASREKRLMTHLGLKGTRESAWRQSAQHQALHKYNHLIKNSDGGGGQFTINFNRSALGDVHTGPKPAARRATFIAADGPGSYHMAYAVVYHLDRILGIYHTPPCVVREMSEVTVSEYQTSTAWYDIFRPLISSDGTLTGILVPPTPKAIKVSKMLLQPLEVMISEVVPFERQDKLQLEYVILWWLGRMKKNRNSHLGYKGHLIHFHADKAFTNTSLDLSGYLNHCQFPNVVYRALSCFRCENEKGSQSKSSEVCNLGEEVALRATTMFPDELELYFHQLQEDDIILSIDSAASSIMKLVNTCIKTFGRHVVLY